MTTKLVLTASGTFIGNPYSITLGVVTDGVITDDDIAKLVASNPTLRLGLPDVPIEEPAVAVQDTIPASEPPAPADAPGVDSGGPLV